MIGTPQAIDGSVVWRPIGVRDLKSIRDHAPGETIVIHGSDGDVLAQASIWWEGTASLHGATTGVVGHYEASDSGAGVAVLRDCVRRLQGRGCAHVVGPMDGTTWRSYRLVTKRSFEGMTEEPPFLMEPENPPEYVEQFVAAGFVPLAKYFSAMDMTMEGDDGRVDEAIARLGKQGIRLRNLDGQRFEEELRRVYELATVSFASNFLYSHIEEAEFVGMYRKVKPLVQEGMVLLAEAGDELLGFMFAMGDVSTPQTKTAIAKTVAVRPGWDGAGLGSALIEMSRRAARAHGYRRLIYGLMHESNRSMRVAKRFGTPFREYTLFASGSDW